MFKTVAHSREKTTAFFPVSGDWPYVQIIVLCCKSKTAHSTWPLYDVAGFQKPSQITKITRYWNPLSYSLTLKCWLYYKTHYNFHPVDTLQSQFQCQFAESERFRSSEVSLSSAQFFNFIGECFTVLLPPHFVIVALDTKHQFCRLCISTVYHINQKTHSSLPGQVTRETKA